MDRLNAVEGSWRRASEYGRPGTVNALEKARLQCAFMLESQSPASPLLIAGLVVGGVWLANMISGIGFTAIVTTADEFWPNMISADRLITVATFTAIMGGAAFIRDRRINALLFVAGMATHLF